MTLSILFEDGCKHLVKEPPAFFTDLNLDQIVGAITAGRQEYDLAPYFYTALNTVDSIRYRHEIMQDIENQNLLGRIRAFSDSMRSVRTYLAQANKLYYSRQKERWMLDAMSVYFDAIRKLSEDLLAADLKSCGLLAFRDFLKEHIESDQFSSFQSEARKLTDALNSIRYCMLIDGSSIRISRYENEADYTAQVEMTFERFRQGTVKNYTTSFPDYPEMNHVEAGILDVVAGLYPDTFSGLTIYCSNLSRCIVDTVSVFEQEVQFYIACLDYIAKFRQADLPFCYPDVSDDCKEIFSSDGFDPALALKLIDKSLPVVCNDFYLKENERIFVVTGPNQGGKTTFARAFGQLHYLASIGCPVPGRGAHLFLPDKIFTHFERKETIHNLRGKLQDDLIRIHDILQQASSRSIIIMNEIFTSTTLKDALFLSSKIMERIISLDLLCVCVTFMDELSLLSETTVSMTSMVVPDSPSMRTFKVERMPADGLAYALSIAERYQVTYEHLMERIAP